MKNIKNKKRELKKKKQKTDRTPFGYLLVLIPQLWHKYQTQCEAIRQL